MNCIICAIAKKENNYIYEWAKYHLGLGFSCIHIYDNNDINGERISDVFNNTELESRVIIHDVRGQRFVQKIVYQDCYDKETFDWCAFIDIDEFITFGEDSNVRTIFDFLKDKNNWEAIHLNWLCYGDCGMVRNTYKPVLDRFKSPKMPLGFYYTYVNRRENEHTKSIIRSGLIIDWSKDDSMYSSNPHTPYGLSLVCNSRGQQVNNSPFSSICHDIAFIRHYTTKTIEEYDAKISRQCADCDNLAFYSYTKYFRINRPSIKTLIWVKRNHPEVRIRDCLRESVKFTILNYNLPFRFLFRSIRHSTN